MSAIIASKPKINWSKLQHTPEVQAEKRISKEIEGLKTLSYEAGMKKIKKISADIESLKKAPISREFTIITSQDLKGTTDASSSGGKTELVNGLQGELAKAQTKIMTKQTAVMAKQFPHSKQHLIIADEYASISMEIRGFTHETFEERALSVRQRIAEFKMLKRSPEMLQKNCTVLELADSLEELFIERETELLIKFHEDSIAFMATLETLEAELETALESIDPKLLKDAEKEWELDEDVQSSVLTTERTLELQVQEMQIAQTEVEFSEFLTEADVDLSEVDAEPSLGHAVAALHDEDPELYMAAGKLAMTFETQDLIEKTKQTTIN